MLNKETRLILLLDKNQFFESDFIKMESYEDKLINFVLYARFTTTKLAKLYNFLTADGSSPLKTGLVVCLSAFKADLFLCGQRSSLVQNLFSYAETWCAEIYLNSWQAGH